MFATTLPAPTSIEVKSGKYGPFNQVQRHVETRWEIGKTAEGHTVVVDVTTRHDSYSKSYSTRATWGKIEQVERHPSDGPGVVSIYSWSSDHRSARLAQLPAARYSKKMMIEVHERAMEALEVGFESSQAYEVFAEASQSVVEEQ